jgi:hypothetical protein
METYGSENNMERYQVTNEKLTKYTDAYPLIDASVVPVKTKTVHDFKTGGERKRRYGIVLSLGGIPNFSEMSDPVVIHQTMPRTVIDGDTIEVLRQRVLAEVDAMFNLLQDTIDGKVNPEEREIEKMPDEHTDIEE